MPPPAWQRLLRTVVDVQPEECVRLMSFFVSFTLTLAAYFLLLPLRDDVGVQVGVKLLPALFLASLAATLAAAPGVSAILAAPRRTKSTSVLILFRIMTGVLLSFYLALFAHGVLLPPSPTSGAGSSPTQDPPLVTKAVFCCLYVWIGLQTLVSTSSLWARASECFDAAAAARLFGFIAAGATLGQLLGSLAAMSYAARRTAGGTPIGIILAAAGCLAVAGEIMGRLKVATQRGGGHDDPAVEEGARRLKPSASDTRRRSHQHQQQQQPLGEAPLPTPGEGGRSPPPSPPPASGLWARLRRRLPTSTRLILGNRFLVFLCSLQLMHYACASLFYFIRTSVAASVHADSNTRTAFFASINSASAAIILLLQLTATGRFMAAVGMPAALSATPLVGLVGMAALAVRPSVAAVLATEVGRKVVHYSAARPAREVLFTRVTEEERYHAKIFIDTVVQRGGDVLGAGVFSLVQANLTGLAPSLVALCSFPICCVWLANAVHVGRMHNRMAVVEIVT